MASADMAVEPGAPEPSDVIDELGRQLVRLTRLSAVFDIKSSTEDERLDQLGLPSGAHRLLAQLARHGPQRSGEVADAVHADPSTVSRQISTLVELGLVERQADPGDGRASLLAVTASGRKAFHFARERRNSTLAHVLHNWDERDQRVLVQLLRRFNEDAEKRKSHGVSSEGPDE